MRLEVQRAIGGFMLAAAYVRNGISEVLNVDAVERAGGAFSYVKREPMRGQRVGGRLTSC
jgi:hypothetical protein